MAHKLDLHYEFGGIESRPNPLSQNPMFAREARNNRVTRDDELARRYGFQSKSDTLIVGQVPFVFGLMEYKFKDINNGKNKSQLIGISGDRYLYRMKRHFLKLTSNSSNCRYYSKYDNFFKFYNSSKTEVASMVILPSTTLEEVRANFSALSGLSIDVEDEDGGSASSSTLKATYIDIAYFKPIFSESTRLDSTFWELIPTTVSGVGNGNLEAEQFKEQSYVNINNSLYFTTGGYVWKYDGSSYYLAGMPEHIPDKTSSSSNISGFYYTEGAAATSFVANKNYHFLIEYCFRDANGIEVSGGFFANDWTGAIDAYNNGNAPGGFGTFTPLHYKSATPKLLTFTIPPIWRNSNFPVYAGKVNGANTIPSGTGTTILNFTTHNFVAGQSLRRVDFNGTYYADVVYYYEIISTTPTTVTVRQHVGSTWIFTGGEIVNAAHVPTELMNKKTESLSPSKEVLNSIYGSYIKLYQSKSLDNSALTNDYTFYAINLIQCPSVATGSFSYGSVDHAGDTNLARISRSTNLYPSFNKLPRFCKSLAKWQNHIVQGGRPKVDSWRNTAYPTINSAITLPINNQIFNGRFNENHLCDFQSLYWSDSDNVEAFFQDGLHEIGFENEIGDKLVGFKEIKDDLMTGKESSLYYLSGTLADNSIVKKRIETTFGCSSHNSIFEAIGSLIWLDKNNGFIAWTPGSLPINVGKGFSENFYDNDFVNYEDRLRIDRARACFHVNDFQYICFVPSANGGKFFVLDLSESLKGQKRFNWYIWDILSSGAPTFNADCGIIYFDNRLFIASDMTGGTFLLNQKRSNSIYDYQDHNANLGIEFEYKTAWLNYGLPSIDKRFLQIIINSIKGGFNLNVRLYANYLQDIISDIQISFLAESSTKKAVKKAIQGVSQKISALSVGFFDNTKEKDIRINGFEVEWSPEFDKGETKK